MEANELRINNLLWFVDEIVKVSSIKNNTSNPQNGSIRVDNQILWIPIDRIEPIPLTEEWLLRFGFRKGKEYFLSPYRDSDEGYFTKMVYNLNEYDFIINSNDYDGHYVKCKYVHQLQNLYFALTCQELEYKE